MIKQQIHQSSLILIDSGLTDSFAEQLLQYKHLFHLDVSCNNISDVLIGNVKALLPQLRVLKVAFTFIGNEGLEIICCHSHCCVQLDISFTKITNQGLKYLTNLKQLKHLSCLTYSTPQILPNRYLQMIFKSPRNQFLMDCKIQAKTQLTINMINQHRLQSLTIACCLSSNQLIHGMNTHLKRLEILQTSTKSILKQGIQKILASPELTDLHLVCWDNDLTEIIKSKSFRALGLPRYNRPLLEQLYQSSSESLTSLNLMGNYITNCHLVGQFKNLTVLNLSANCLEDEATSYLVGLSCLTHLYLDDNQIQGCHFLSKMLSLVELDLCTNQIGDEGAIQLSNLVNLKILLLKQNRIGNAGAIAITKMSSLAGLALMQNQIADEGALELIKMGWLRYLYLQENHISEECKMTINSTTVDTHVQV